jgi:hypothetical protein
MRPTSKRDRRRLVLRREQLRQLNTGQIARMLGGVTPTYSAQPCTESCAACTLTTGPTSTQICAD